MEFSSDTSPTIAWPGQLLSQSVWLYFDYPWCSFMNHLLRSLNGIFISPGLMIHLNTCCKKNNVKNYWNHMSYDIVASSFSLNQMWRHILAYLWAYLMETQVVCFWIFDILDEEGQDYLLGIVCFPSECFHYIPGSLPEGIYKVATQTNCFPCPNSPTIIRLPLVSFMLY